MSRPASRWRLLGMLAGLALPSTAPAAPFLPDFASATFVPGAPVDNPYFPMLDTRTRIFEGEDERFELTVLGPGPVILGVQTTTQRDRAFEDDLLVEETFDFFAQDDDGNVWYFGEDVTNYFYDSMGNLIGTDSASSWRAGENLANPGGDPAQPGFIMPVDLTIGFNYYQEFALDDEAVDQGTTNAVGLSVSLDFGDFDDVIRVLETTAAEPDARGFKYYARGQGLILEEEGLDENFENPELVIPLTQVVPDPRSVELLGVGIVALALHRGRSRPSRS